MYFAEGPNVVEIKDVDKVEVARLKYEKLKNTKDNRAKAVERNRQTALKKEAVQARKDVKRNKHN
jgi:hypothetical protein